MTSAGFWLDLALLVVLAALVYASFRLRIMGTAPASSAAHGPGKTLHWTSKFPAVAQQAGLDPQRLRWPFWAAKLLRALLVPLAILDVIQRIGMRIPFLLVLILALAGFLVPDGWLRLQRRRRQGRIRRALSFFLDLLVALLKAGLSLEEAFRRAGREGLDASHPLAIEVDRTARELEAGTSRSDAFQSLANRVGIGELRAVASALTLAARHGTSAEAALETQADLLRTKDRELVRRKVTVAATKAVFPLFLCGFPVFLVIVLFPAILELLEMFHALVDLF